jgi:uncharacterized protein YbbC (DUF1343 family)
MKKYVLIIFLQFLIIVSSCVSNRYETPQEELIEIAGQSADRTEEVFVQTGLDMLFRVHLEKLQGKNVGLVVNHTAVDRNRIHLVDRLLEHDISIKAIFAPEHGYRGEAAAGQKIQDGVDPVSGAKVYSLYGINRKPSSEMIQGLDVIIYDIQDVGVRFYTYISTLGYVMQAASDAGIDFWVLDRPNPINGYVADGPVLEWEFQSFVGLYPIPVRYGLTVGELSRMIVSENWLDFAGDFRPVVIRMEGWDRIMWFDDTGLPWVAPSPNMPDLETATVYPGMCFIEGTNVSEGRGTDRPFLQIGAPWIDGGELALTLNARQLSGVEFQPVEFRPVDMPGRAVNPKYEDELCQGITLRVTDRESFESVRTGIHVLHVLNVLYPDKFQWRKSAIDRLYGSDNLREFFQTNAPVDSLFTIWEDDQLTYSGLLHYYMIYY